MNKPQTITAGQAKKIMSELTGDHKLIFAVSVESGLRISDVLNLRVGSLDRVFTIQERKTRKKRKIELSDALLNDLRELTAHRSAREYVFLSRRKHGTHIHRATYHRHLQCVYEALEIKFSAHSTRKLYAQEVLRKTGDICEVQKALNHKFLSDTCTYLDLNFGEIIQAATKRIQSQNF